MEKLPPSIPGKRYFTIGEVSQLCGVKSHVLRYWEQEFTQLRPIKRRGNRRYYQHNEVLMILRIRGLLYDEGFTVNGARNKLLEVADTYNSKRPDGNVVLNVLEVLDNVNSSAGNFGACEHIQDTFFLTASSDLPNEMWAQQRLQLVRRELFELRDLLTPSRQEGY